MSQRASYQKIPNITLGVKKPPVKNRAKKVLKGASYFTSSFPSVIVAPKPKPKPKGRTVLKLKA